MVLVLARYGLDRTAKVVGLAAFGGGSMIAALALPRLLDTLPDGRAMLGEALVLVISLAAGILLPGYGWLLQLWLALGLG